MRRGKPRDRNAGRTQSPSAEQALRFFGSAGLKVRLQQREFDQVMLRAAAANALVFGGERSLPKVMELGKRPNAVIKVSGACTLSRQPYPFPDIWDPLARVRTTRRALPQD